MMTKERTKAHEQAVRDLRLARYELDELNERVRISDLRVMELNERVRISDLRADVAQESAQAALLNRLEYGQRAVQRAVQEANGRTESEALRANLAEAQLRRAHLALVAALLGAT
jgi:hypothetical protein